MSTVPFRAPSPLLLLLAATGLSLASVSPLTAQGAAEERAGRTGADRAAQTDPDANIGPPGWPRNLALFVGLLSYDRAMEDAVHELRARRHPGWEDAASTAKKFGNWQQALPVFAAGSALVGVVTEGTTGLEKTLAMLGGVFAGSMANETLNQLVGRRRPSEDAGAFAFDPLHGHASFPSGHAAFGFSMAGSVDAATDSWLLAAAAYTAAGATAASRLYHGKHWVSDVVVGAVIGTTVSRWSTRWAMERLGVGEDDPSAKEGMGPSGEEARPSGDEAATSLLHRIHPVATPTYLGVTIRF